MYHSRPPAAVSGYARCAGGTGAAGAVVPAAGFSRSRISPSNFSLAVGSTTGELLAEIEVLPTGGWDKWTELTAPLKPASRGDVFVVFVNPGKGGLMNLDWIQFNLR